MLRHRVTEPLRDSDADPRAAMCRNCGAPAPGAYCPACGQETRLALPSARQFLREAAGRYVPLDGRLWRTLFGLVFRPGFLTREYFAGRRRRYVRPARLFLVLSLALFALLRIVSDAPIVIADDADKGAVARGGEEFDIALDDQMNVQVTGIALPEQVQKRIDRFNRLPRQVKYDQIFQGVIRYGPYALFALLPLFAVLLQIVYAGRHRRHPLRPRKYAEHLVFGAHNHAFLCVALMLVAVPVGPLRFALVAWIAVYFLRSMKVVYDGSWLGVAVRAWAIAIAYFTSFAFVVAGLLVAAVLLA